jgi:hypothetical protein
MCEPKNKENSESNTKDCLAALLAQAEPELELVKL